MQSIVAEGGESVAESYGNSKGKIAEKQMCKCTLCVMTTILLSSGSCTKQFLSSQSLQ